MDTALKLIELNTKLPYLWIFAALGIYFLLCWLVGIVYVVRDQLPFKMGFLTRVFYISLPIVLGPFGVLFYLLLTSLDPVYDKSNDIHEDERMISAGDAMDKAESMMSKHKVVQPAESNYSDASRDIKIEDNNYAEKTQERKSIENPAKKSPESNKKKVSNEMFQIWMSGLKSSFNRSFKSVKNDKKMVNQYEIGVDGEIKPAKKKLGFMDVLKNTTNQTMNITNRSLAIAKNRTRDFAVVVQKKIKNGNKKKNTVK